MNTNDYIESGILEAYALGALPVNEAQQVETDIAMHAELKTELLAIENVMQVFTAKFAKELPAGLDNKIWGALQYSSANAGYNQSAPKVIPFTPNYRKPMAWQYAAAAVIIIGSLALNVFLLGKDKIRTAEMQALNEKMGQMQSDQMQLASLVNDYEKNKAMMADTTMQTIVMHTMQPGHPMAATIYWSKGRGEAYVNVDGLPAPPKGMQYQLWVLQDGKPVDMGVLPNAIANTPAMQKVSKQVTNGQAFAISLEKEGGSPTPTMQNIYVMGKTS